MPAPAQPRPPADARTHDLGPRTGARTLARAPREAVRHWRAREARASIHAWVLAGLVLVAAALTAFFGPTQLVLRSTAERVALETAATLVAAVAALLFAHRFWRLQRLRDLLLAGGVALIASSHLGARVLVAGGLAGAVNQVAWLVVAGRIAGWAVIAGAIAVPNPPVPPAVPRRRRIEIAFALLPAAALSGLVLGARAAAGHGPGARMINAQAALLAAYALVALLAALAALRCVREAADEHDRLPLLLAAGCGLGSAASLAACAQPTFSAATVGVGDLLRVGWIAALLAYACGQWLRDAQRAPIDAVAQERRRMAADIHDLIMQDLCLALANARALSNDPLRASQAGTVVSAGERALAGAREVMGALRASSTRRLDTAIEDSVRAAARGKPVTFKTHGVARATQPDERTRTVLIHIAREAVTNAVKHAHPTTIEVVLAYVGRWQLTVHDDGTGMHTDAPPRERTHRVMHNLWHASPNGHPDPDRLGGFGLASMRSEAEALGGRLRVQSAAAGTTVEALLP
jgi:signal transduction histidine kinase